MRTGGTLLALLAACGGTRETGDTGGGGAAGAVASAATGAGGSLAAASTGGTAAQTAGAGGAMCATHVSYGDAWIHPANHPAQTDDVLDTVSWDGACTADGGNSFALLSNGWKPYFKGASGCVIALDANCAPAQCTTRVTYGAAWIAAPNHPAPYDDVPGRVFWDGACKNQNGQSVATLSNGWAPHFTGSNACALSFRYVGCGGLYENAVVPEGCADPGVVRDGATWIAACTSGNAPNAFPIRTSPDLVTWKPAGAIFPAAKKPAWAASDFWAPEIHKVGAHYVAYFTARHKDGRLSIGAATAASVTGPFTDIGQPLVHDATMGMIDATEFEAGGTAYLVWKEDGNAVGKPTPIHGQPLTADGTALTGTPNTLIKNDLPWEGGVVEGPWVVAHGGNYYLFYSGNAYYNGNYAVGVARASAPLGPYQKLGAPILTTNGSWIGPGHCSVVDSPAGGTAMLYHAWAPGHVNGPGDVRAMLLDPVVWTDWPALPMAPSAGSRPRF